MRPRTLLLVLAAGIFAANVWRYHDYLLDDSFISFRYARNLIAGNGLVYNVGERVEGYTDFLFVLLAAAAMKLGIDPVIGTRLVSFASALATLYLVWRLGQRGARAAGTAPLLLLLSIPAFAYWSVASFETMMFTALLTAAMLLSFAEARDGRLRGAAVAFVLLSLTRPEGVLFFAATTAAIFARELIVDRERASWRRHAASSLLFAVLFGAYFGARWRYYGHFLPNTFTAKVTGGEGQLATGLDYLRRSAVAAPALGLALVFPLALVAQRLRRRLAADAELPVIYAVLLSYAIYAIGVGGDSMAFARFYVPVLPLSCVLVSRTLAAIEVEAWCGRALAVALLVNLAPFFFAKDACVAFVADHDAAIGERVGRWFGGTLAAGSLIAVNPAGAIPYFSELPAIDMLGLTDDKIATRPVYIVSQGWAGHRRGWGRYVLTRRPQAILWYNNAGGREPFYLGDHELAADPYFRFFYRLRAATLPEDGGAPARRPVERLLGLPFGSHPSGEARLGNLAVQATFHLGPIPWTEFHPAPISLSYFERDRRDDDLWELSASLGADVAGFVRAVAASWRATATAPARIEAAERGEIEKICARAEERIRARDFEAGRKLLADAVERNQRVRSPLPYQYLANLAVITSDLLLAITAQKEALRLAPENSVYEANLTRLLTAPYPRNQSGG